MNSQDQSRSATGSNDQVDEAPNAKPQAHPAKKAASPSTSPRQVSGFDWTALGVVILISAFFAITARINAQPATSFVPVVALSATGCGLLVTAIRKLHTSKGAGLLEATLSGFFMALFQFTVAITYPGVFDSLSLGQVLRDDFLITWGLVAIFSIAFSIAGATLGHLAFAPLRPLPNRSSPTVEIEGKDLDATLDAQAVRHSNEEEEPLNAVTRSEDEENTARTGAQDSHSVDTPETSSFQQPARSVTGYLFTILLLGLAPTVVAYLFSAAYDFILSFNQFVPGPYPTLRLLSTLLPWQIPLPIDLNSNIRNIIIFSLLWRIPLFLGNPTPFDLQALEPYIFNGAALGLLLLTVNRQKSSTAYQSSPLGWTAYLSLAAAFGLVLVLPANLWVWRGLEGVLQFQEIVIPIRTLSILNPLTFSLNLVTGPFVCMSIGVVLRRFLNKSKA
jgi:hypothetical protein